MATAEAAAPETKPAPRPETIQRKLQAFIIGPVDSNGTPIGIAKASDVAATKELPPDELMNSLATDGKLLLPPFDKLVLAMLTENSSSLGPVIGAMAQNVDGFGHHLEIRIKMDEPSTPEHIKKEVMAERARLVNFFANCNPDYSFTELRRRTRVDMECTGEGYWEVIRTINQDIVGFNHIPSYQVLLGVQDIDLTTFTRTVPEAQADGSVKLAKVQARKRFRRFIQTRVSSVFGRGASFHRGSEYRWFKEFGDPRVVDNRNGEVVTEQDKLNLLPEAQRASELLHFKIYSPRTPYGLPRFIGNLITIFGDRAADEVNYHTLKNNNVPSILLMVANGQLTQSSVDRLQEFVNGQVAGNNNFSKIVIVEAEGQFEGTESATPKMSIEKLTSEQLKDQLFQAYSANNADKVRQAFRLPPIFVGRSDDYTRSTAEASRRLADEQVFAPERAEFDTLFNQRILPEIGVVYHTFVSNSPNITDDEDLINVMSTAERSGGMTPKLARKIIADILGLDEHSLPPLDPSIKPDVPFTIQVAEAVKNEAEPGHQLAVKSMSDLGSSTVMALLKLRNDLEVAMLKRNRGRATE
jgi:capsid portal protein